MSACICFHHFNHIFTFSPFAMPRFCWEILPLQFAECIHVWIFEDMSLNHTNLGWKDLKLFIVMTVKKCWSEIVFYRKNTSGHPFIKFWLMKCPPPGTCMTNRVARFSWNIREKRWMCVHGDAFVCNVMFPSCLRISNLSLEIEFYICRGWHKPFDVASWKIFPPSHITLPFLYVIIINIHWHVCGFLYKTTILFFRGGKWNFIVTISAWFFSGFEGWMLH